MGSFVSVQQYDAKKTPVVTNMLQCPSFFGHVTVSCNGKRNITMKESPLGSFVMRGIIGGRM